MLPDVNNVAEKISGSGNQKGKWGIAIFVALVFLWVIYTNLTIQPLFFPFNLLIDRTPVGDYPLALQNFILVLIIFLLARKYYRLTSDEIGWKLPAKNDLIKWTLIALVPALAFLSWQIKWSSTTADVWQMYIAPTFFIVLPLVISEELLVRGIFYGLLKRVMDVRWTLIIQAIVFGLIHFKSYPGQYYSWIVIAGLGYLFGLAREKSGSLAPGTLAHFLNNILANLASGVLY